jgi:hypothetical protein
MTVTFDEFIRKVHTTFPFATVGEDSDGQLIIYTDLQIHPTTAKGEQAELVVPFYPPDEE